MDNLPKPDEPEVITTRRSLPKVPIIIAVLIILFLAIILGLKYFNLISFPKMPNFFLKPPATSSFSAKLTGKPTSASKVTLSCPVEKEFCNQAKTLEVVIFDNKRYNGLGFNLPKGTSLLAAFPGKLIQKNIDSGKFRLLILVAPNNNWQARYIYASQKPLTAQEEKTAESGVMVKEKDKIATISGGFLSNLGYKDSNFQFFVTENKDNGKIKTINMEDLGTLILP